MIDSRVADPVSATGLESVAEQAIIAIVVRRAGWQRRVKHGAGKYRTCGTRNRKHDQKWIDPTRKEKPLHNEVGRRSNVARFRTEGQEKCGNRAHLLHSMVVASSNWQWQRRIERHCVAEDSVVSRHPGLARLLRGQ